MRKKRWLYVLLFAYLAVLFKITVFRSGFGSYGLCANGRINPGLFTEYIPLIQTCDWDRFIYLFVGNVIWFVPLGVYAQYRSSKPAILRAGVAGLLLSLCIETLQYLFGTGISELDDLILNTAGAVLGALPVFFFKKKTAVFL